MRVPFRWSPWIGQDVLLRQIVTGPKRWRRCLILFGSDTVYLRKLHQQPTDLPRVEDTAISSPFVIDSTTRHTFSARETVQSGLARRRQSDAPRLVEWVEIPSFNRGSERQSRLLEEAPSVHMRLDCHAPHWYQMKWCGNHFKL